MNPKDVPVVILAGGKGTRLSEETKTIPKPLLKIGPTPIIGHIVNWYLDYGFSRFIIPIGYLGDEIVHFFMGREEERESISVVDTGLDSQTGGRLGRLSKYLHSTFMMTYGDGLADVDLEALLNYHRYCVETQDTWATITCVHPVPRFGAIDLNREGFITDFGEKRELSHSWINGGFMVLEPEILTKFDLNDDVNLEKDVLPVLAGMGKLKGFIHEGFWHCIDTLRDLELAREMYNRGEAKWISGKTKE